MNRHWRFFAKCPGTTLLQCLFCVHSMSFYKGKLPVQGMNLLDRRFIKGAFVAGFVGLSNQFLDVRFQFFKGSLEA